VRHAAGFLGRAMAVVCGLVLLVARPARAAEPTLERFLAEVLERNPGLKARGQEAQSYRHDASAAGILPDPEVSIMLDRVPERMGGEMPMLRYQVNQMLPWPGKLGLMRDALLRRADGRSAVARAKVLDLTREAKQAFLMLRTNARLRELNRVNRELLTTIVEATLARYGAGTGGHHEVARAEVERGALDVEAIDLDGERVSTVAMMNALRYRPVDTPIADPPGFDGVEPVIPALAEMTRLAEARRPELQAMRAMRREEATMAELNRRERLPDLMAGIWYNQMLGAPDTGGVMLGANLPIFGVPRRNRMAEASELRARSADSDVEAMRSMIRFEVADALRRLRTTSRALELLHTIAEPRARESYGSSLSAYVTGSTDILGVLEAWRALQRVERADLELLSARELAWIDLEHAVSGPLPRTTP
jgi:outer membrane protein, heavy metal efflux system